MFWLHTSKNCWCSCQNVIDICVERVNWLPSSFLRSNLSWGLIFPLLWAHPWRSLNFCAPSFEQRKLRTVPPSPDTKAPGPPQLINRCVLVPSQAQPLKWQSRGPIIVKNWKLNIGFISSVIKGPWNWFNAAALLLGGFLQREHKTMSSSHLLINPPNPAKLISHHNFARN